MTRQLGVGLLEGLGRFGHLLADVALLARGLGQPCLGAVDSRRQRITRLLEVLHPVADGGQRIQELQDRLVPALDVDARLLVPGGQLGRLGLQDGDTLGRLGRGLLEGLDLAADPSRFLATLVVPLVHLGGALVLVGSRRAPGGDPRLELGPALVQGAQLAGQLGRAGRLAFDLVRERDLLALPARERHSRPSSAARVSPRRRSRARRGGDRAGRSRRHG